MRLAFSVAINVDADILLIDEILAVGDQHFQDKCFRKLEELKNSDKTIVIVSHSLEVVKKLCNRAIWLYNGEVKMDGRPDEVIENYLNQVSLDHLEERLKAIESGTYHYKGLTYIDEPKKYQSFPKNLSFISCHGWMISDDPNVKLQVSIDDTILDEKMVTRYRRKDVYEAFKEEFAGLVDMDTLGWKLELPCTDLCEGEHILKVACFGDDGQVMSESKSEIYFE